MRERNSEMENMKVKKLQSGETIISREAGNSMTPILKSRQPVRIEPADIDDIQIGDIVYCKVKGNYYTHKVYGKGEKGVLIGNNHKHMNGWTKNIYGKVIEILPMTYKK